LHLISTNHPQALIRGSSTRLCSHSPPPFDMENLQCLRCSRWAQVKGNGNDVLITRMRLVTCVCTIAPFGSSPFFPYSHGSYAKAPFSPPHWGLGPNPSPSRIVTALHFQAVPFLQKMCAKANTASPWAILLLSPTSHPYTLKGLEPSLSVRSEPSVVLCAGTVSA
jgi:hypothetical protein